jgi:hypothetical protein
MSQAIKLANSVANNNPNDTLIAYGIGSTLAVILMTKGRKLAARRLGNSYTLYTLHAVVEAVEAQIEIDLHHVVVNGT